MVRQLRRLHSAIRGVANLSRLWQLLQLRDETLDGLRLGNVVVSSSFIMIITMICAPPQPMLVLLAVCVRDLTSGGPSYQGRAVVRQAGTRHEGMG
jgi:hypothetical protein